MFARLYAFGNKTKRALYIRYLDIYAERVHALGYNGAKMFDTIFLAHLLSKPIYVM